MYEIGDLAHVAFPGVLGLHKAMWHGYILCLKYFSLGTCTILSRHKHSKTKHMVLAFPVSYTG